MSASTTHQRLPLLRLSSIRSCVRRLTNSTFRAVPYCGAVVAILLLATVPALADNVAFFYALDADLQTLKQQAREIGQPVTVGSR